MESDLGLNAQFVKGQNIPIRNCWHFSTDGSLVDFLFRDDEDFIAGMNRIFILCQKYNVVILAFVLMDTHVHFILWGELGECKRFMHEYLKLTSMHISDKYGDRHKLENVFPNYQVIDNDLYLKMAICYVHKNPPVAGIQYLAQDYPWSSAPLIFRKKGYWTSCDWAASMRDSSCVKERELRNILNTKSAPNVDFHLIGNLVFPGEYVAVDIVEKIFRTHKSFNFFMCHAKESDIESVKGSISRLSLPYAELHQHKIEFCQKYFGVRSIRSLSTTQRVALAKKLRASYNCSPKQIASACGLIYSEVKDML